MRVQWAGVGQYVGINIYALAALVGKPKHKYAKLLLCVRVCVCVCYFALCVLRLVPAGNTDSHAYTHQTSHSVGPQLPPTPLPLFPFCVAPLLLRLCLCLVYYSCCVLPYTITRTLRLPVSSLLAPPPLTAPLPPFKWRIKY